MSLLTLNPSPLRPKCRAGERLLQWVGVNTPPVPPIIEVPLLQHISNVAVRASLQDPGSYGSALRKFHLFCDIFTIPETQRLPASFSLLHSFAVWAATDPEIVIPDLHATNALPPFEPVSVKTIRNYLSGVRAWHIAQGWPAPLSDPDLDRINFTLRGLANIQAGIRKRPIRPPISLQMLIALRATLILSDPYDACIWAMACCAFWGMMRFGEVSVSSRAAFNGSKHLKRKDAFMGTDDNMKAYARLDLPSAKTAKPGETQSVFLVAQPFACPLEALRNLAKVVPAGPNDPLFSWRDRSGCIRPMVKSSALHKINTVLKTWGWGTTFGHSFRIGGASFYLARGVNPEIVRLAGRWRSLAYEAYIRAFEQIVSVHMGSLFQ